MAPCGMATLVAVMALRTSSRDKPRAASCLGLTCRRTARAWPPWTETSPTPSTSDSFGMSAVAANSVMACIGIESDVSAITRTGMSAGLIW